MEDENQLIMITAEACGYCRYIYPHAKELCDDVHIMFILLDCDNLPSAFEYPDAFPTFIFRVNKSITETWAGSNLDKLKEKMQLNFGYIK